MECKLVDQIFTDRSYLEFAKSAEDFLTLYKGCLYKSANKKEEFEVLEEYLYKFSNYAFPFCVVLFSENKALLTAEKCAVDGVIEGKFLKTKIRSEELFIPKLKIINNEALLEDEKTILEEDVDFDSFLVFGKEYLAFLRFLKLFDYRLDKRVLESYFVTERKNVLIRKEVLTNYSLLSEDVSQVFYSYKDSFQEKFFLEELSKLITAMKLSGYKSLKTENLLVNTRQGEVMFFDFVSSVVTGIENTREKVSISQVVKQLKNDRDVYIELIKLKKFEEVRRLSVEVIRFIYAISGIMEGAINA